MQFRKIPLSQEKRPKKNAVKLSWKQSVRDGHLCSIVKKKVKAVILLLVADNFRCGGIQSTYLELDNGYQ